MEGGFTFDGVDISTLGQEYAPENQNTYVYNAAPWKMDDETFDAHNGGYFYGTTVQPKDFTQRCFYEGAHINEGSMTRIMHFFRRGRTGRLIFKTRPWCWYVATVASIDIGQMMSYLNGVVTIKMRAYYPFARTDQTYIYENDPNEANLLANTAMLKGVEWDLSKNFAETTLTSEDTFQIYNPGTERAAVSIEIAGDVGEGITIYNDATQQTCKIVALTNADTTAKNKYLIVDSLSGKVLMTNGTDTEHAFFYHDNGFIDLASNFPANRNIRASGTFGTNTLTLSEPVDDSMVGKYFAMRHTSSGVLGTAMLGYLVLGNQSASDLFKSRIVRVEDGGTTIVIADNIPSPTSGSSTSFTIDAAVVSFNNITVKPVSTMALTKLIFRYKPTFE